MVTGKGDPVAVLMNIRTRPLPAKGYKQDDFKYTFINEISSSTSSSRQKGSTSSKKERKIYTAKPLSSDTHTRMYPHYVAYLRTLIFDF